MSRYIYQEDASSSWGELERAVPCADLCHCTQTMNSSRVHDYLLSVSVATHELNFWSVVRPYLRQPQCIPSVSTVCSDICLCDS